MVQVLSAAGPVMRWEEEDVRVVVGRTWAIKSRVFTSKIGIPRGQEFLHTLPVWSSTHLLTSFAYRHSVTSVCPHVTPSSSTSQHPRSEQMRKPRYCDTGKQETLGGCSELEKE